MDSHVVGAPHRRPARCHTQARHHRRAGHRRRTAPPHNDPQRPLSPAVPPPPPPKEKTASVSHILTNAIIYQSFLLELTALVQVRAGLFNEVRFT